MSNPRHGGKDKKTRAWTLDDEWDAKVRRDCATALAQWMKGSLDLSRKFKTLKMNELENMAQSVIAAWVVQASRRITEASDSPDVRAIKHWLA